MTAIKLIALFFVVMAGIKMVVVFRNPTSWKSVVKAVFAKPLYTQVVSLALAAVILRYLLAELTIVQIVAVMTFMVALIMFQFACFGTEVIELSDRFLNDRSILKKVWPSLVIWVALMLWALAAIFAS